MPSPVTYDLPAPEDRVTLTRVFVSKADAAKLKRIARSTQQPQLWHQREALRLYLDLFTDEGERR